MINFVAVKILTNDKKKLFRTLLGDFHAAIIAPFTTTTYYIHYFFFK